MTNKFSHLTLKNRQLIEQELDNKSSIKGISSLLNKDYSTIRKEMKNRKVKYEHSGWGNYKAQCIKRRTC